MKKGLSLALASSVCLCLAGCKGGKGVLAWLLIPVAVLALLLALMRTYNHYQYMQKAKKQDFTCPVTKATHLWDVKPLT